MKLKLPIPLILGALLATVPAFAQGTSADYARASQMSKQFSKSVFSKKVNPNWSEDGNSFWYRVENGPQNAEFVDALRGTRRVAFDHQKLAEALSRETKTSVEAGDLPFRQISVAPDGSWTRFRIGKTTWQTDAQGALKRAPVALQLDSLKPLDKAHKTRAAVARRLM